jgi:hypothetical protein
MGSGWMIKTFDRARWDDIFGAGTSVAEQKILDAMLWDEEGYFDPDAEELRPGPQRDQVLASMEGRAALVLARRLAYEGLTPPKAIRLDEFVAAMGSEGTRRRIGRRMAFGPISFQGGAWRNWLTARH